MSEDGGNFLSRWSRRKIEARRAPAPAEPASLPTTARAAVPPVDNRNDAPDAAVPLPPIEELRGLQSEYRDFLRPEIDESLRRSALKKLFHDPHFNTMDGLDTYIDDYTKADPIPDAMLKALNQAQGLIFDREEAPEEDGQQRAAAGGEDAPKTIVGPVSAAPHDEGAAAPAQPVPSKASDAS
jgi:hypothetical protein